MSSKHNHHSSSHPHQLSTTKLSDLRGTIWDQMYLMFLEKLTEGALLASGGKELPNIDHVVETAITYATKAYEARKVSLKGYDNSKLPPKVKIVKEEDDEIEEEEEEDND
jgi:hypothetical protein